MTAGREERAEDTRGRRGRMAGGSNGVDKRLRL